MDEQEAEVDSKQSKLLLEGKYATQTRGQRDRRWISVQISVSLKFVFSFLCHDKLRQVWQQVLSFYFNKCVAKNISQEG